MNLNVDTEVMVRLGLSPTQYLVAQLCSAYSFLMKGTGVGRIAEVLDVDSGSITKAMRHLIDVGLLEKRDNGFFYPSQKWYIAHDGEEVTVVSEADTIGAEVVEYFNKINGTKYQLTNAESVKKILKSNPKLTINHFKSVIVHKYETWGNDEKMKEYNRPSTLFSSKFLKYLDDANHYWINKQKHDSATEITGN
jgi:uncharacterized phage protein (TIGR02220 family)